MPRFLCLSGMRTNKEFMQFQLDNAGWSDLATFVTIDPTYPAEKPADKAIKPFLTNPNVYQWFFYDEDAALRLSAEGAYDKLSQLKFTGHDESMQRVVKELQEGDYDGILCFSQGCFMGSALIHLMQQGKLPNLIKRAVFVCGMYIPWMYEGMMTVKNIPVPTLHVCSKQDFAYKHSLDLLSRYADPIKITHDKGHVLPKLASLPAEDQARVRSFLSLES